MATLTGKTALVTGAGRGIGAAIARRLAADGARVIVHYSQSAAKAEALVAELTATGAEADTVQGDLASLDAVDAMVATLRGKVDGIDILVNNSGRGSGRSDSTLAGMSVEDYDTIFSLNTRALIFVTQRVLPLLRDGGRIINISSTAIDARVPGLAAYAGSKAAVDCFTRVWATELAPRRITVNSIQPGMVDTDLITDNMGEEVKQVAARHHPLGRIGQPDDLADVVAFLAGPDSRWVNGQIIIANGGI
jgi:3-oxoacyl-[acyl-carrier protein] reductase